MTWHSKASLGARHPIHNWEYADTAARTGATGFASFDIGKVAKQLDDDTLWVLTATTPTWQPLAGGTSGHLPWFKDEFTPTAGQITFILSQGPADPTSLKFYVNGVLVDDIADYTVSGTNVTWLDNYVMETTDKVIIYYQ
jgi:hypothetical protein